MSSQPREFVARRAAIEVLDELAISNYPVDPVWVAAENGLEIEEWERFPEGCYGALIRNGNTYHIAVSAACPTPGHRRFTLAHEIAHYRIEGHVEGLGWNGPIALSMGGHYRSRKDPIEVEADHFASELLMPARFVRPLVEAIPPSLAAVRDLARQFETSVSCAAIRFVGLSPEPVIVVLSRDRVIEWTAFSRHFDSLSWNRFRSWKGEWAPRGSATLRLVGDPQAVLLGTEDSEAGLLCEWFEGAPRALELLEEAVGLGRFGRVLTVLTCPDFPELDAAEEEGYEDDEEQDWKSPLRGYRLG